MYTIVIFILFVLIVYMILRTIYSKVEILEEEKQLPDESIIFNVDNFNIWFNDPDNGASYAHKGIFLRLDKLSEHHIEEYLEFKYGIKHCGPFLWSKSTNEMINNFHKEIRKDWLLKNDNVRNSN